MVPQGRLRREVLGGAHHLTRPRHLRLAEGTGDTEVGDLHLTLVGDEDVRGLDVAVHDARLVGRLETVGGLAHERDDLRRRQPAGVLVDHRGEGGAAHVLHHEVVGVGVATEVVHLRDVRVAEPGSGARFLVEPTGELGIFGQLAADHLHRNGAVEHVVVRDPDLAHPATGDS